MCCCQPDGAQFGPAQGRHCSLILQPCSQGPPEEETGQWEEKLVLLLPVCRHRAALIQLRQRGVSWGDSG